MLNDNIKRYRKAKGLSQEELANQLNVVRQTVSKWENGLSVPDSTMLTVLAEVLDTSVSALLTETREEKKKEDLQILSEKLERIELQMTNRNRKKMKIIRSMLLLFCALLGIMLIVFAAMKSSYLNWDYNNIEYAIAGTILHGLEFIFVRVAPFVFILSIIGMQITKRYNF